MWLIILAFLKKAGWFVVDNWKVVAIAFAVIFTVVFVYRACGPRPAKLNEKQILKAQKAIAENDRKAMEEVLVDSDVKEKQIDMDVSNAKAETINATVEARKKAAAMTNDELAAELERRANQ